MSDRPVLVAVAGGSGSGKSTLVSELCDRLDDRVSLILMDDYYHDRTDISKAERERIDYDSIDALDIPHLMSQLHDLRQGVPVEGPQYDFDSHTRKSATRTIRPANWILIDGILVLAHHELRKFFDIKIFVDAPESIRLRRRLERDVRDRGRTEESVRRQWAETVKPNHERLVEPSKMYADYVVNGAERQSWETVMQLLNRE